MMTIREYKRAESLEEAWQLNQKKKQSGHRRYDLAQDGKDQRRHRH